MPEDLQKKVLAMEDEIVAGRKDIWEGPIVKQDGTEVVPAGTAVSMEQVETMDFLVKGVIGAAQ